jgi:adenylosuccinate lyase
MIERYTRAQMGDIWATESRFAQMLRVEIAVAEVQAELGIIPAEAFAAIRQKSKFNVKRILEIEQKTKHDVIAFVSNVAESVGKFGAFVHYGMTSSDVLDTALSLQIAESEKVLLQSANKLRNALIKSAKKYRTTLCAGRTHGIHAEPTSFGLKLLGFVTELDRNILRLKSAFANAAVAKLSGAVGTYSGQSPEVEEKVAKLLGLTPETVATQVIPRDRHAEIFSALAILGGGIERLAVELRHLQRTEVGEVIEGFSKGQKGSSAMPHKRNPISGENLTGIARLLRGYALTALENVALWHERDISHSSVERVVFPDAFIVADYALDRLAGVVDNLEVNEERMLTNMDLSAGQLFSSHLLLHLVKAGLSREDAYALVQSASHTLKKGEHLRDKVASQKKITKYLTKKTIYEIFSGKSHKKSIEAQVKRVLNGLSKGNSSLRG